MGNCSSQPADTAQPPQDAVQKINNDIEELRVDAQPRRSSTTPRQRQSTSSSALRGANLSASDAQQLSSEARTEPKAWVGHSRPDQQEQTGPNPPNTVNGSPDHIACPEKTHHQDHQAPYQDAEHTNPLEENKDGVFTPPAGPNDPAEPLERDSPPSSLLPPSERIGATNPLKGRRQQNGVHCPFPPAFAPMRLSEAHLVKLPVMRRAELEARTQMWITCCVLQLPARPIPNVDAVWPDPPVQPPLLKE